MIKPHGDSKSILMLLSCKQVHHRVRRPFCLSPKCMTTEHLKDADLLILTLLSFRSISQYISLHCKLCNLSVSLPAAGNSLNHLNSRILLFLLFLLLSYLQCHDTLKQQYIKLVIVTPSLYYCNMVIWRAAKRGNGKRRQGWRGGITTPAKLYHGKQ